MPGLAPVASLFAATVDSANQQAGQQQQMAKGGLEKDQQQQLDSRVNGGNGQAQETEQGNLQPNADVGVQPIGVEQGQGQLHPRIAGVQPNGFVKGCNNSHWYLGHKHWWTILPLIVGVQGRDGVCWLWSCFALVYGLGIHSNLLLVSQCNILWRVQRIVQYL